LQVELQGTKSNRSAIGAQVTLKAGVRTLYQEVKGSEGFGATNPLRLHFGLGALQEVDSIEIRFPSGARQTLGKVQGRQVIRVVEGTEGFKQPTK
jgi:hypothetical protein